MATATLDEWTEEKCLQLIREYRARPILWDPKDPLYFKKNKKIVAWMELGEAINVTPEKCKHKMIVLMSSFRREKAKILHSLKDKDPTEVYKSTWFGFKDMAFLMDKETERKRQSQLDIDDEDYEERVERISRTMQRESPVPAPAKRRRSTTSISRAVKQEFNQMVTQSIREDIVTPLLPPPVQTPAERDEEIKSFTSFIGNKMKKYSETTKNAVQQAICDIIFKADQNNFEPSSFDKFTIIDDDPDPLDKTLFNSQYNAVIKVQSDSDDSS
ncbi:unnamed protein product [Chrysodeixis includens]|uniref:MADF domain-containing protein n=1 Tax=Chrysodeixis includens TaxID=689277 RepID=A0A9P0FQC3_CHRIL|nr:unnamed protein product [Chrysodeixis includens]